MTRPRVLECFSVSDYPLVRSLFELFDEYLNLFNYLIENKSSGLTAKALAQLDAQSMGKTDPINFDAKSVISDAESADTFRSWASNWSDCTNATFNKVYKYWNSNSALHKEVSRYLIIYCLSILSNLIDRFWPF